MLFSKFVKKESVSCLIWIGEKRLAGCSYYSSSVSYKIQSMSRVSRGGQVGSLYPARYTADDIVLLVSTLCKRPGHNIVVSF